MQFIPLVFVEISIAVVDILTFISRINIPSECFPFNQQWLSGAHELSMNLKKFYKLESIVINGLDGKTHKAVTLVQSSFYMIRHFLTQALWFSKPQFCHAFEK